MNGNKSKHIKPGSSGLPCTLVTGASSGIGFELARQLAEASVPVVAVGRNRERLQVLADRYPHVDVVLMDMNDIDTIAAIAAGIAARHPDLSCLINNAGIQHNVRVDDGAYSAGDIREEVNVNLVAPMVLTHALLGHLATRQRAWIVNVTSGLGLVPKQTSAVYSATKAGLHLFTQGLRVQLRGSTVRVVEAVMPLVDTPMTQGRGSGKMPAAKAAAQLIDGLLAGADEIWIGKARALPLLQRLAPGLLARVMQRS